MEIELREEGGKLGSRVWSEEEESGQIRQKIRTERRGRGAVGWFQSSSCGFPGIAEHQTILSIDVVRVQIHLNSLCNEVVQISGFGGKYLGVLQNSVGVTEAVFCQSRFVQLYQPADTTRQICSGKTRLQSHPQNSTRHRDTFHQNQISGPPHYRGY